MNPTPNSTDNPDPLRARMSRVRDWDGKHDPVTRLTIEEQTARTVNPNLDLAKLAALLPPKPRSAPLAPPYHANPPGSFVVYAITRVHFLADGKRVVVPGNPGFLLGRYQKYAWFLLKGTSPGLKKFSEEWPEMERDLLKVPEGPPVVISKIDPGWTDPENPPDSGDFIHEVYRTLDGRNSGITSLENFYPPDEVTVLPPGIVYPRWLKCPHAWDRLPVSSDRRWRFFSSGPSSLLFPTHLRKTKKRENAFLSGLLLDEIDRPKPQPVTEQI